jgi:predicted anti-sigma-YlaC factor YlaD
MQPAVELRACTQARRMLSLALDGEAAASDVLMAAMHLGSCSLCRQFARRVAVVTNELRSVGTSSPDHRGMQCTKGERQ